MKNNLKTALGLEDANVEINFNIDTDENGAPIDGKDEDGEDLVETTDAEVVEAEAETDRAEDEINELEEAQEALESIDLVLEKHSTQGTISQETMQMYAAVMKHITGNDVMASVGFESRTSTHNALLARTLLADSIERINAISMEASDGFLDKIGHALTSLLSKNKALVKRIGRIRQVINLQREQGIENKGQVQFNTMTGVKSKYLVAVDLNGGRQLIKEAKEFVKFMTSINVPADGDLSDVTKLFSTSGAWERLNNNGKTVYQALGMQVQFLEGDNSKENIVTRVKLTDVNKLSESKKRKVNALSLDECETLLDIFSEFLDKSVILKDVEKLVKKHKQDSTGLLLSSASFFRGLYSTTLSIANEVINFVYASLDSKVKPAKKENESMESFDLAMEQFELLDPYEQFEVASMEGLSTIIDDVKGLFSKESSIIKKANAVLTLAEQASGEKATTETVPVNSKEGIKAEIINTKEFTEEEFIEECKKFALVLNNVLDAHDALDAGERIAPAIMKGIKGNKLEVFNLDITRDGEKLSVVNREVESVERLPLLTAASVKEVISTVLEVSKSGNVGAILKTLTTEYNGALAKLKKVLDTESPSVDQAEDAEVLTQLLKKRVDTLDEIVSYCFACVSDREKK